MNGKVYIADLTTDELETLIRSAVADAMMETPRWVKGLNGIKEIFQCSYSTARRIKDSGSINGAIHQQGRTFMVDANKALKLFGESHKNKNRIY